MPSLPRPRPAAIRVAIVSALLVALAGCGSGLASDGDRGDAHASAQQSAASGGCPETVMATLGSVLQRVYKEGVDSERTASASHLIQYSVPLRQAIETGDAKAAKAAARELLAT